MKFSYKVTYCNTEFGIQYGIVCEADGKPYSAINDISPDKTTVENITCKLNEGEVSANQFADVVEDSII